MPFVHSIQSKRTVEFNAETLNDIMNEFEMFLRGAGFHFNGQLDIVEEEEFKEEETETSETGSWNWTVGQLMKGPVTLQDVTKEDTFVSPDINLNLSNYGAAQPTISFPPGVDTITITGTTTGVKCELCGLDKNTMKSHHCYDDNCPKGTW
jgi:hypothetical protein